MHRIRRAIAQCVKEPHPRLVTALLRIRREEFKRRPVSNPFQIFIGLIVFVCLIVFGFRVHLSGTQAVQTAVLMLLIGALLIYLGKVFPGEEEVLIRDRAEIDRLIRKALILVSEGTDTSSVVLDNEDRKELLNIFEGQDLPDALGRIVLKEREPSLMPDV